MNFNPDRVFTGLGVELDDRIIEEAAVKPEKEAEKPGKEAEKPGRAMEEVEVTRGSLLPPADHGGDDVTYVGIRL